MINRNNGRCSCDNHDEDINVLGDMETKIDVTSFFSQLNRINLSGDGSTRDR